MPGPDDSSIHEFYARFYDAAPHSRTHALFCERVYGRDLCQHGYATMAQLDRLIELANLGAGTFLLDLGCGTGQIVEYISDVTGARAHGIDYIPNAIRLAHDRTVAKRGRLSFTVGDMYALDVPAQPYDTAIAIDTLFANDLTPLVIALKGLIKPGGQIVAYHGKILFDDDDDLALVEPENLPLTQALNVHGLACEIWDVTLEEFERSQRAQQAAEDLKADFEAEGNGFLYENRMMEAHGNIRFIEAGRMSRCLYHVTL